MMTLVFDSRTSEEISKDAEVLGFKHPGMLADLKDDIPLGYSPRKSPGKRKASRQVQGFSPKIPGKRKAPRRSCHASATLQAAAMSSGRGVLTYFGLLHELPVEYAK